MARRRAGTAIRKSWDARRIGRALAHQGADLRHWVSYATVAAVDDNGAVDLSNPNAIVISPAGIDVDVVLEPSGYPMTCRYGQAAAGFFFAGPIKVGDQVVVEIPDGDPSMIGKIVGVTSDPDGGGVPVGDDGKPIFQNDRVLIMAKGVPLDMRTDGGAQILANANGSISLSAKGGAQVALNTDGTTQTGSGADQQMMAGTAYRTAQNVLDEGSTVAMGTAATACAAATTLPTVITAVQAVGTMLDTIIGLLQTFEGQAPTFLSAKNKVAK